MTRTHVITGATGFIGLALIIELLRRTDDSIVAIVRPGDGSAKQRFHAALANAAGIYGRRAEVRAALGRCQVVAGDVLEEECGVREKLSARRVQLWHSAASLRYEDRYEGEIRATNVEGTRQALALARRLEVEAFNYISTAYVAGKASGVIREEPVQGFATNNHYEQSKVDAERLVDAEGSFRRRILRPGIVMGHGATRAATAFNGFYGFLRQLVQLRGMLERTQAGLSERTALRMRVDPDAGLSVATVDAVAEEMVRIGLSDGAEGVFHVTHPSPPAVGMVIRAMARAVGLREPTFAPNKDGFTWIDGRFDRRLDFYGSYIVGDKRFDRRRSDQVLGGRHAHDVTFDDPSIDSFARWYLARLSEQRGGLPAAR